MRLDTVKTILFGPKTKYINVHAHGSRPYYLRNLPFYKRYPRAFAMCGGFLAFCTVFSGTIYRSFFQDQTDLPPTAFMWQSEKIRGTTNLEKLRERITRNKSAYEQAMEDIAAAKRDIELKKQEQQKQA